MAAAVVARSVLRSATATRSSAARVSAGAKASGARSPFFIRPQKPLSHRIFRSPVEMSCVAVESLFRFHTATSSALLTSMLSTAPYSSGWLIDVGGLFGSGLSISQDRGKTRHHLPLPDPALEWDILDS